MKLISLNAWGCRITEPLFEFIKQGSETVDIYCFQEVLKGGKGKSGRGEIKNGYEMLGDILPGYSGYFFEYGEGGYYSESSKNLDFKYGIACFVKNSLSHSFGKGVTLYNLDIKWNDYSGRFAAGAALALQVNDYVIVNVHGLWQGGIKEDTEAKIEQSKKIIEIAEMFKGKKVIAGDFNLLPHTASIKMLGDKYEDLIEKNHISSTRGSLYTKPLRYSDYAFLDRKIVAKSFTVMSMDISDHLPLVIEFE